MPDKTAIKWSLFIVFIAFFLRIWSFYNPIVDVDEPQFAGFANAILAGGVPYVASLDTKPLGIYWFFSAVFWLFGRNNMIAVHIATAVVVVLTALFCYLTAARLYSRRAGFLAALFYVVFTTAYIPKFIGTSITIIMMLPLTASVYFLVRWEGTKRQRDVFIAGLLWGIACLFKYQAGINLIVVGVYFLILRPLCERRLAGVKLKEFAVFVIGGALVGSLFALYLAEAGAWNAFVRWSLEGSANYIKAAEGHTYFWKGLLTRGLPVIASALLIWCLAVIRSVKAVRLALSPGELLVILWLALSAIPVCTGGKFYGHYFFQMYPALCILASQPATEMRKKLAIFLCVIGIALPAVGFFTARFFADAIYAKLGEENPKGYIPIAEYIKGRTKEGDRIFVWGFATSIYTYSDRDSASRFLWCDPLTGRISGTPSANDPNFDTTKFIAKGSWELFFEDMQKNKPVYFVDTSPGNHHDYDKYPVSKYPALVRYLRENFIHEMTINGADVYRVR